MKQLNEFSTGYPSSYTNSQSQEYGGVFGPVDAEVVQGKDRLNAKTAEGLHRINVFLAHFFRRTSLNPQNDVAQLKARLNHLNLDFDFDNTKPIEPINNYIVTEGGNAFGVTPTTDLSKGFDTGSDLPQYNLEVRVSKTDTGYKLEAKMSPLNQVAENLHMNSKRDQRIAFIKEVFYNKLQEAISPNIGRFVKKLGTQSKKKTDGTEKTPAKAKEEKIKQKQKTQNKIPDFEKGKENKTPKEFD